MGLSDEERQRDERARDLPREHGLPWVGLRGRLDANNSEAVPPHAAPHGADGQPEQALLGLLLFFVLGGTQQGPSRGEQRDRRPTSPPASANSNPTSGAARHVAANLALPWRHVLAIFALPMAAHLGCVRGSQPDSPLGDGGARGPPAAWAFLGRSSRPLATSRERASEHGDGDEGKQSGTVGFASGELAVRRGPSTQWVTQ